MNRNSLKTTRKAAVRLAISAIVAGLFAVPQVSADSMAGGAASTETGGPQQSQSTSGATTQNSSSSGGANNGNSTTSSTTQNQSTAETKNVSNSGDGPIGQSIAQRTVKTTGVQVKTSTPARRAVVSSNTTVRKKKAWKTVNYNWKNGRKTVVR